jgi:hypothetical protein
LVLSPGLSILLAERRGLASRLSGGERMENGGWRAAVSRESTPLFAIPSCGRAASGVCQASKISKPELG